jgi:1-phosphatidylinositol-3-phosphate 5-kinase
MTPRSDFGALGTPPRSSTPNEKDKENLPQAAMRRTLLAEPQEPTKEKEGWGSVTSTLTSNFAHLLRFGTDVTDSISSRVRTPANDGAGAGGSTLRPGNTADASTSTRTRSLASAFMNPLSQFNSLSIRGNTVDRPNTPANRDGTDGGLSNALSLFYNRDTEDKPHIQFSFTLPGRTRISCTVYYAAAFDTLRRRCAVDRSFIKSLENTIGWAAEGGKSKANFWKSEDGRLVVKELVSKWNVSDM